MPKRKSVEAAESAPVISEPKATARKTSAKPKSAVGSVAHKHHAKKSVEPVVEAPATEIGIAVESAAPKVSHEAIATLAYLYWEARGPQIGNPEEDWLRAERDLSKLA